MAALLRGSSIQTWALGFVIMALSNAAFAQLVLYDNFNSTLIDPTKWLGGQTYDLDMREAQRGLVPTPKVAGDRRLLLMQRGYSAITDNNGASGGVFNLAFANPNKITAVSFTLAVGSVGAVGCTTNSSIAGVSTGFGGSFFNPSSTPNGAAGDVKAVIFVDRLSSTGSTLSVGAGYFQCNDAGCSSITSLFAAGLGSVKINSKNTFSLTWDHANHRFTFQLNNNTPVTSTYTVGDGFPPGYPYKDLETTRTVPHCVSTPRPYITINAYFDDVYVNP
ncbi:MAG TPA: hypothetical protein VJP02_06860 [Candidatus Sulfotelmatobacter sp.]|nr:hypothetical protein [Candidatus Sulfotelmatobacter sp.]